MNGCGGVVYESTIVLVDIWQWSQEVRVTDGVELNVGLKNFKIGGFVSSHDGVNTFHYIIIHKISELCYDRIL